MIHEYLQNLTNSFKHTSLFIIIFYTGVIYALYHLLNLSGDVLFPTHPRSKEFAIFLMVFYSFLFMIGGLLLTISEEVGVTKSFPNKIVSKGFQIITQRKIEII